MVESSKHTLTWWEVRNIQAQDLEDIERPDFVALDKDDQVVLIAEVQGFPFYFKEQKAKENATLQLINLWQAAKALIPFAMLVDGENILIFKWDGNNFSEPIVRLSTADVLSHYDPNFSRKKIYSLYLKTLAEAWISDISKHWKLATPPASKEMAEIGLLQLLKDGKTQVYY